MIFRLSAFLLIVLLSGVASAACTSPAGSEGTLNYDFTNHVLNYCNGTSWVSTSGPTSGEIAAFNSASCPSGWSEFTAARGRFLRGIDNGAGNDPDGTRTPGATQADAFQGHYHSLKTYYDTNWGYQNANTGAKGDIQNSGVGVNNTVNTDTRVQAASTDGTNGTPRTSSETRPKNVAVIFCSKN